MKIIRLLEGLYEELKTFNERCPENLSLFANETKNVRDRFLFDMEKQKLWFDTHFEKLEWKEKHGDMTEGENKHNRGYPIRYMTDVEKMSLKLWVRKHLEEKNIDLQSIAVNPWTLNSAYSFLYSSSNYLTKSARNLISAALGYGSFDDLLEAYRQKKESAA